MPALWRAFFYIKGGRSEGGSANDRSGADSLGGIPCKAVVHARILDLLFHFHCTWLLRQFL